MPRQPTLFDVAYSNLLASGTGRVKATLTATAALSYVWQLAHAAQKLGRWPNQAEYADFWEINERTAQRQWSRFRRAFPGETTPDRLARAVLEQSAGHVESPACAYNALAPEALAAA